MHLARIFMDHLLVLVTYFVTFWTKFVAFILLIVPMFACMLMGMFRPTVDLKIQLISASPPPPPPTNTHAHTPTHTYKPFYKITMIVRALWLAKRRVCMTVCKHGCDVKAYCFSGANHASTNLKRFWVENWTSLLIAHSLFDWNL